jgi:hypothetical protein
MSCIRYDLYPKEFCNKSYPDGHLELRLPKHFVILSNHFSTLRSTNEHIYATEILCVGVVLEYLPYMHDLAISVRLDCALGEET